MGFNPIDLTGRRILVTGASSGIGRATAAHLSKLGANLVLVARNEAALRETLSRLEDGDHSWRAVDLSDIAAIEPLIKEITAEKGPLSGLAHCAGTGDVRSLPMTKYDFLHRVMLINFYAFVELARCFCKRGHFAERSSVVGVSSVASPRGEKAKLAYSASKAAMDSAVRVMALELWEKGIRVNTVVPGLIRTEMHERFIKVVGEDAAKAEVGKQFMGIGEPVDVANAIAFLLSDAAKLISGTALSVDGGWLTK